MESLEFGGKFLGTKHSQDPTGASQVQPRQGGAAPERGRSPRQAKKEVNMFLYE